MAVKSYQNYPAPLILVQGAWISVNQVVLDGTTKFAYSIVPTTSPFTGGTSSLFEVRTFLSSPVGSPKITPSLYSDNPVTAKPNAVVANGAGVESGVLGAGWNSLSWTAPLPTLVEGTRYWIILNLTAGTTIRVNHLQTPDINPPITVYGEAGGANGRSETASGVDGVWAGTQYADAAGLRVGTTDGTDTAYWGMPVSAASASITAVGTRVDGTQSVGTAFTFPGTGTFNLRSIVFKMIKVGTPGNLTCVIYAGSAVVATATSAVRLATDVTTAAITNYMFDFNPSVALTMGSMYRIVLSAASGSNAANYYTFYGNISLDSDANSLALQRWGNYLTMLSGGAWTDTTTSIIAFGVIPDLLVGPFTPSGGSGGASMYPIVIGSI